MGRRTTDTWGWHIVEDQDTVEQRRLSRRTMIKGTVGATAAMWAAPAVTTFGSGAMAASLVPQCSAGANFECPGGDPGPTENCGTSGPLARCICDQTVDGRDFCWEDYFCAGATLCASDSDCPPGFGCVTSCCDGDSGGPTCAPVCGTNTLRTSARTTGGHTASGK